MNCGGEEGSFLLQRLPFLVTVAVFAAAVLLALIFTARGKFYTLQGDVQQTIHSQQTPLIVLDLTYNADSLIRAPMYHRWIVDIMLAKVQRPLREVGVSFSLPHLENVCALAPVYSNSLVLLNVGSLSPIPPAEYAQCVKNAGATNVGLLVTNAECPGTAMDGAPCGQGAPALDHRQDPLLFDYAFMNYLWTPLAAWAQAHGVDHQYLPLGPLYYSGPIQGADRAASKRSKLCFFAGSPDHGDRAQMFSALKASSLPCNVSANIHGHEYSDALIDSIFALTPYGNNPESFRFWEALEHGAIPVMVRIADSRMDFGGFTGIPFIALESWSDLDTALMPFVARTHVVGENTVVVSSAADVLQEQVLIAYRTFIGRVQDEVASAIECSFKGKKKCV